MSKREHLRSMVGVIIIFAMLLSIIVLLITS